MSNYFKKSENHINELNNSRNVLPPEKAATGKPKPRQRGLTNRVCCHPSSKHIKVHPNISNVIQMNPHNPQFDFAEMQGLLRFEVETISNPEDRQMISRSLSIYRNDQT